MISSRCAMEESAWQLADCAMGRATARMQVMKRLANHLNSRKRHSILETFEINFLCKPDLT